MSSIDLPHTHLTNAFIEGHTFVDSAGMRVAVRIADAGAISLPTGRLVAADPLLDLFQPPFKFAVAPDTYPVLVSLIGGDIGLVMVRFDDGAPVHWKPARPGTFSVDSGIACLMDHNIARFLRRKAEREQYEKYAHRFENAIEDNETGWGYAQPNPNSQGSIFLFRTHDGDGHFPAYVAYDRNGNLNCLVIDMVTPIAG